MSLKFCSEIILSVCDEQKSRQSNLQRDPIRERRDRIWNKIHFEFLTPVPKASQSIDIEYTNGLEFQIV